jgi:hypothetical protein
MVSASVPPPVASKPIFAPLAPSAAPRSALKLSALESTTY